MPRVIISAWRVCDGSSERAVVHSNEMCTFTALCHLNNVYCWSPKKHLWSFSVTATKSIKHILHSVYQKTQNAQNILFPFVPIQSYSQIGLSESDGPMEMSAV